MSGWEIVVSVWVGDVCTYPPGSPGPWELLWALLGPWGGAAAWSQAPLRARPRPVAQAHQSAAGEAGVLELLCRLLGGGSGDRSEEPEPEVADLQQVVGGGARVLDLILLDGRLARRFLRVSAGVG